MNEALAALKAAHPAYIGLQLAWHLDGPGNWIFIWWSEDSAYVSCVGWDQRESTTREVLWTYPA